MKYFLIFLFGDITMYLILIWLNKSYNPFWGMKDNVNTFADKITLSLMVFGLWFIWIPIIGVALIRSILILKPCLQEWVKGNQFEIYEMSQLNKEISFDTKMSLVSIIEKNGRLRRLPSFIFTTSLGTKIKIKDKNLIILK